MPEACEKPTPEQKNPGCGSHVAPGGYTVDLSLVNRLVPTLMETIRMLRFGPAQTPESVAGVIPDFCKIIHLHTDCKGGQAFPHGIVQGCFEGRPFGVNHSLLQHQSVG